MSESAERQRGDHDRRTNSSAWAETIDLSPRQTDMNAEGHAFKPRPTAPEPQDFSTNSRRLPTLASFFAPSQAMSDDVRSLLRSRLRAVSFLLGSGFLLFLIQMVLLRSRESLVIFHTVCTALLLGLAVWMRPARLWKAWELRTIEALIFLGVLTYFAAIQYTHVGQAIRDGSVAWAEVQRDSGRLEAERVEPLVRASVELASTVRLSIFCIFILIVTYGLLIPNRWPRTAGYVLLCFLVTGVTQLMVLRGEIGGRAFVSRVANVSHVSTNLLLLALGGLLSVYGSWVIHNLRREIIEAKRLGQYRLGRRIGGGGMGQVYLAEHQLLKRPCAIKLIREDRAGDAVALRRFEREVQSTARLSHWNTVDIYDYGRTEDGTFYYVMEYLQGLSLDELVNRHGPLPPSRVVYLLSQACAALVEAHEMGLIHRDLKPANLFASHRGGLWDVTKILDFGLVKPTRVRAATVETDIPDEQSVVGSPLFMAPEQVLGLSPVDGRCDLHAMGACAYFLLTGQAPFQGESASKVMAAVVRDPVVPLRVIRPDIPEDLERVVLQCLEKKPELRPHSAQALFLALQSCKCATNWTSERAARWWTVHEPDRLATEISLSAQ